jgi:hypothetical protein
LSQDKLKLNKFSLSGTPEKFYQVKQAKQRKVIITRKNFTEAEEK